MFHKLQGGALHCAITFSVGSSYLLFGYDQGVLGGLVTQPSFLNAIGNPSPSFLGTIVALYTIGCLVGCIIAATFGKQLGRRKVIFWGSIIMVVGGTIQASTYGSGQLIAGRLISGLGNGMNSSTVPMYVSEISRSTARGRAVAIQLSMVIFGSLIAYWLDYGSAKNLTGDVLWRFPIAFQNFFALITISTILFLPETPRWLYSKGLVAEAKTTFSRLMGCSDDDPEVIFFINEMEQAILLEEQQSQITLRNLFYDKTEVKSMRRLVLCFLVQFFQQFTGVNVIDFYVTIVLQTNVGLSRETSSLVAGCIYIFFWFGSLPPIVLLDKYGRRPILLFGSTTLLITMAIFTACIAVDTRGSAGTAVAMLFLYQFTFAMSWCGVSWLYAPEITPLRLRHVGSAVGSFSQWLWTFVIAQMTPAAIANTGWRIYLLFCIFLLISIPFVYFFLPETNNKTLEEIDYIFVKNGVRGIAPPHVEEATPDVSLDQLKSPGNEHAEYVSAS